MNMEKMPNVQAVSPTEIGSETLPTIVNEGEDALSRESESLMKHEQALDDTSPQDPEVRLEEVEEQQERIQKRLEEIEEEKREREENIKKFLEQAAMIIGEEGGLGQKIQKMNEMKLFDLLPDSAVNLIQENLEKFRHLDYQVAEDFLKDENLENEKHKLLEQQEINDKKLGSLEAFSYEEIPQIEVSSERKEDSSKEEAAQQENLPELDEAGTTEALELEQTEPFPAIEQTNPLPDIDVNR